MFEDIQNYGRYIQNKGAAGPLAPVTPLGWYEPTIHDKDNKSMSISFIPIHDHVGTGPPATIMY
jgi:hypothetical protein